MPTSSSHIAERRSEPAASITPFTLPPAEPERVNVDSPINLFLESSPITDVFEIPAEFMLNPYKERSVVARKIFSVDLLEALRKEQVQQTWRYVTNGQKHAIRDSYGAMPTILIVRMAPPGSFM
ncbi:hypothetical protein HDU89_006124 [Geranomyces variabilis]|nr:hypothetical protein HDU89_006124 [Geranomyces variabilis]